MRIATISKPELCTSYIQTPGPWTSDFDRVYAGENDVSNVVANCPHHFPRAVVVANARLIAAAPDLLAALQQFSQAFDRGPFQVGRALIAARSAIAKATGETE